MKKRRNEELALERKRNATISEAKKCMKNVKVGVWIPYSPKKYQFIKDNLQELNAIAELKDPAFKIVAFDDERRQVRFIYIPAK